MGLGCFFLHVAMIVVILRSMSVLYAKLAQWKIDSIGTSVIRSHNFADSGSLLHLMKRKIIRNNKVTGFHIDSSV